MSEPYSAAARHSIATRSIGKTKEAEAIEAQIRAKGGPVVAAGGAPQPGQPQQFPGPGPGQPAGYGAGPGYPAQPQPVSQAGYYPPQPQQVHRSSAKTKLSFLVHGYVLLSP